MKRSRRDYFGAWCYVIPVVVLTLFGIVPFVAVALQSFSVMSETGTLSLPRSIDGYREILQPHRLSILGQIVERGAIVASLDLIVAIPVSFVLVRAVGSRARTICLVLLTLPFFASDVSRAFAWNMVLGQHGFINRALLALHLVDNPIPWLIFDELAVRIALFSGTVSFAVFPLVIRLTTIRPSIWLATRDLGISRLREFTGIALPLSVPAAVFGWIASFVVCVSSSAETSMLGGARQMDLVRLVSDLEGAQKLPAVFALCTLLALSIGLVGYAGIRVVRGRYAVESLRLEPPRSHA